MRNLRSHTAILALFLSACPVAGQEASAKDPILEPSPSGAESIAPIGERLSRASVIRSSFVQTKRIAALTRPIVSEGTMLFVRGTGVAWRIEKPSPSTFIVTPKRIVRREEGRRDAVISAADRPEVRFFSEIFLSLFSGDLEALERKFSVHSTYGTGGAHWRIGLKAKDRSLERYLSSILLEGGEHLERVEIREGEGDVSEIAFGDVAISTEPPNDAERAWFE